MGEGIAAAVEWLIGALGWVADFLDPVWEILVGLWPPILAGIAIVAVLRIFRWLLLLWRGRTPRVQISPFAWASSDGAEREATWVTSLFREQLAALRLDALDPLPERAPGAPLVEIVEGVGQGVGRDIGAAAGRLFRAIMPDSAYEVWGSLRPDENGGGRISVQLIERRRGNRTLLNVALQGKSWEKGAREAAMAVAGALYPRVRKGDRGPWTLWERSVPRALMDHYHSARRYEEANQLEHALDAFHAALELDPLNPNLRLKIAMLQERMELYLDAWVTYEAIVDEKDPRAWRGPDRRVYLLALYRLAVMLSNGCVAEQWVKGSWLGENEGDLRDQARRARRRDLLLSLKGNSIFERRRGQLRPDELLERVPWTISSLIRNANGNALMSVLAWIDPEAKEIGDVLKPFAATARKKGEIKRRTQQIEAVLQILGLRRLEELETALRRLPPRPSNWHDSWVRQPPLRGMLRRPDFGRSAVRTSKLLVRTRIAASLESQVKRRDKQDEDFDERDRWIEEIREAHRQITKRWPFPPVNAWRRTLHWVAPRRRWENGRKDAWQLHYNAACATASLLRNKSVLRNYEREVKDKKPEVPGAGFEPLPSRTGEDRVIARAIAQLEEYAYRAGSPRVAAQADWVAIDDPDFGGLRETHQFELWASHHLPLEIPKGQASRRADVKRFTVRVVHQGARAFATTWRQRAAAAEPAAPQLVEWWRREAEVWSVLGNACREHLSWEERLKWLQTLEDWLEETEQEDAVEFGYEARGAAANSMSETLFEELAALTGASRNGSPPAVGADIPCALAWVNNRVEHVRRAYEAGEERADAEGMLLWENEHEEALRAARAWMRLAEILELELTGACKEDSEEELRERMARVRAEFNGVPEPQAA